MLFNVFPPEKYEAVCFVKDLGNRGFCEAKFAGVFSGGATPDPIPNSEVKPASGDGSAVVTLWESSTMPAFFYKPD